MKILIINPPRVNGYPIVREERFEHTETDSVYPPLSHLYTAAYLEHNGFEVKLLDANGFDLNLKDVEQEIISFKPQLIYGRIGFDTHNVDLQVHELARKHGAISVTRNRIISEVPELRDKLLHLGCVDLFINQDPEQIMLDIAERIRDNKPIHDIKGTSYYDHKKKLVIHNPIATELVNFDELPSPAYHLLPNIKPYYSGVLLPKPFVMIQTSNGCPFACTFCAYNKAQYKTRTPSKVANELANLKKQWNIKSFVVFDDMFTLYKDRAKEICKELIKKDLNLQWTCCTRVSSVDDELISLMKQAGCVEIAFGIESGSEEILRKIKKGITKEMITKAVNICKKYNMKFYCMIIIGLPGETEETFKETLSFVKTLNPFYTQFGFAVPFPNTELYKYLKEKGLILTEDWSKYNTLQREPLARTEDLTAERLIEMKQQAYKETSLNPLQVIKNIFTTKKNHFDIESNLRGIKLVTAKFNKKRLLR